MWYELMFIMMFGMILGIKLVGDCFTFFIIECTTVCTTRLKQV